MHARVLGVVVASALWLMPHGIAAQLEGYPETRVPGALAEGDPGVLGCQYDREGNTWTNSWGYTQTQVSVYLVDFCWDGTTVTISGYAGACPSPGFGWDTIHCQWVGLRTTGTWSEYAYLKLWGEFSDGGSSFHQLQMDFVVAPNGYYNCEHYAWGNYPGSIEINCL